MSNGNLVILNGNIGRDAEVRYTPAGMCVANFSVATSKVWKDKQTGQQKEKTDWHNCVCFDKIGERAAKQILKGKPIYLEGEINYNPSEKNGVKLVYTTIKVTSFRVMEHPPKGSNFSSAENALPAENDNAGNYAPADSFDQFDDDIPF